MPLAEAVAVDPDAYCDDHYDDSYCDNERVTHDQTLKSGPLLLLLQLGLVFIIKVSSEGSLLLFVPVKVVVIYLI